jgi:plasmid stabilization system protein ParE
MAFKILYHEDALADLEEVFSWSSVQHPKTTERFANDLFNYIDFLQNFPYLGASVKGHANVRRLLHSPLYVYYSVQADRGGIEILHIWHMTRMPPSL